MNDENPLFDFDNVDRIKRRDYTKSLIGVGIFFTALTTIDIRILNKMKAGKTMGVAKKLFLINVLNSPFYFYFYNDISKKYMDLKKHLVTKYLIIGDELLFKKQK